MEKKDAHPRFQFGRNFALTAAQLDSAGDVVIRASDASGAALLELSLPVSEMEGAPAKRRMAQADPEGRPHVTITYSASVRFAHI